MLAVVRELVQRYARHPSFAGLALRLSGDGYAQLPGPDWGMDDATIARFERETGLSVPGEGPGRFAARAAFLGRRGPSRAVAPVAGRRLPPLLPPLRAVLAAARPDAPLYLAGAEMFAGPELGVQLRPTLPPPRHADRGPAVVRNRPPAVPGRPRHLVLLRPERIVPANRLAAQAADLEIGQMPEADAYFRGLPRPGSLFFHPPQEVHVPSFDAEEPLPAELRLAGDPAGALGPQNRRRFVHSLAAMDSQVLVDGGWLLPLGQEESVRERGGRLPPAAAGALRRSCDGRAGPARSR